jgi:antitoxin component YwqK of YwqJK toxin-antitoxin module
MAKQQKPERPESVPPEARWVAKDNQWELGAGKGKSRQGPWKFWRADGTVEFECTMQNGVPHGPYKRWHESGELSQEGTYVEGAFHGRRVFIGSDKPTTEPRADEWISPLVWRSELDFELGQLKASRHFDKQGNPINSDGSPVPQRPRGVAEKAEYRFEDQSWVDVPLDKEGRRHGRLKSWTKEGKRLEEADWEHGRRHGAARRFGPMGTVKEEGRYRKDERTGVFRFYTDDGRVEAEREYHGGAQTGHAEEYDEAGQLELEETYVRGQRDGVFRLKTSFWNPRVAEVQGSWRKGLPESPWTLMGHDGVPLELLEMGTQDGALGSAPVFTDRAQSEEAWAAQAKAFEDNGQRNLALVAWARCAAMACKAEPLFAALGRLSIPVVGPRGDRILAEARAPGTVEALLTGLRIGASAHRVFEELALRLDGASRSRAALDLINAAILFAPEDPELCFSRARILMSLGLADAAEREAQALASTDPERSEALLDLWRVMFCEYGFWPTGQAFPTDVPSATAVREADAVSEVVQVLASRLMRTRAGLLERVKPGPRWIVPEMPELLPEGPLELKVSRGRGKNKPVDQTRGLARWPEVPALLKAARADWSALTWLCWAVGGDGVTLPSKIAPRAELGPAVALANLRIERVRQRISGEFVSGPRLDWEGLELGSMDPGLLPLAEAELSEVQSVMTWLVNEDAPNPWQEPPRPKA